MSEIVDPIVVTPGKELETPEFFKKDIERISGEVFDKKIADVPSGVKLYRHRLSLTASINSVTTDVKFNIVSTIKTPVSSYTGGPSRLDSITFSSIVSTFAEGNKIINPTEYANDTVMITGYEINTSAGVNIYILQSIAFVSDTVTEL